MRKKIMIVFGTRPEAIKMAPVVLELSKHRDKIQTIVTVTGQHREMLDQVLQLFNIKPDYDLNIMKKGQNLYDVTSKVLLGMGNILKEERPDLILVHGDTTTSMTAALAGFYEKIPVGHVEAGLRTYNLQSPWPEELNRQLTGRIVDFHFAPTERSKNNLTKEAISDQSIFITGNTVIDALHIVLEKIKNNPDQKSEIIQYLKSKNLSETLLASWENNTRKMILITGHRRENFGEGFQNICRAIVQSAKQFPEVDFVYPVHLNPNVQKPVQQIIDTAQCKNILLLPPLDYLPFIYLLNLSYFVLTDSGGIQEEAPGIGKPVLLMRENTERPEALAYGTVELVGTDFEKIMGGITKLITDHKLYQKMSLSKNPYGDGRAAKKIVDHIFKSFNLITA